VYGCDATVETVRSDEYIAKYIGEFDEPHPDPDEDEEDDREPLDYVEEACRRYFPCMVGLRAVKGKS